MLLCQPSGSFFTQTPSFLAYQRKMQQTKGRNNAQSLFQAENIPSDPQIRNLLDPLEPSLLDDLYWQGWAILEELGLLRNFESFNQQYLISLDGTQYFSSQKIHCPNCLHRQLGNDETPFTITTPLPLSWLILNKNRSSIYPLSSSNPKMGTPSKIANKPPPKGGWINKPRICHRVKLRS